MYDYSSVNQSVASLINQIKKNKIKFDHALQRTEVWDEFRKSLLIQSILIGVPIEPLLFVYNEKDKIYDCMQGKQRLKTSIFNFVENKYKLHADTPPVIDENGNEIIVAKHKFEDLPEEFQIKIKECNLIIWRFSNITQDEIEELFSRINNGMSLSGIELTRTKMESLSQFQSISKHPAIDIAVSEAGKKKYVNEQVAIHLWIIFYNENPSFLTSFLRKSMPNAIVTKEQEEEINSALDYLKLLYKDVISIKPLFRKMRAKTHIVSLAYMAHLAIKKGISVEEYIEKAKIFFSSEEKNATISDEYNFTIGAGSAKPEQLRVRKNELEKALA